MIQGYAQYGVRGGTRRGGYGEFALENVYEEVGNCTPNPAGNIGQAGVIAQGSRVKIEGGEAPTGLKPARNQPFDLDLMCESSPGNILPARQEGRQSPSQDLFAAQDRPPQRFRNSRARAMYASDPFDFTS